MAESVGFRRTSAVEVVEEHMRCPDGHENSEGMRFCGQCGAPLSSAVDTTAPLPPAPTPEVPVAPFDPASSGAPLAPPAPPPLPSAPASARRRVPLLIGALVVIAALIGAFVLLNGDESDTIRLRGSFTLVDSDFEITGSWTSCRGTGGYDDFEAGANVTVRDGDGKIIASGETVNADRSNIDDLALIDQVVGESRNPDNLQLDQNDIDEFRTTFESMADSGYYCVLYFEAEVPVSEFYEVSIGSRGELSYSREELAATGYMISLSLGG